MSRAPARWSPVRVLLFTGKGGVGKTTLAAATATRLAEHGSKVLLVSTDPAHSLADAVGMPLDAEPCELELESGRPGPHVAEVHTRTLVDRSWEELREHLRVLLRGAGVGDVDAEELTVLPGVEDLLALTEVQRFAASGTWDVVIVDCGPTAETLRLLALPESLSAYLERLFPAHRRLARGLLAGMAGSEDVERWDAAADALGKLADRLVALRELLVDDATRVRLVLTPEAVVAAETRRTLTALGLHRIRVDGLIANRVVPSPGEANGPAAHWLRTRRAEQDAVLDSLRVSANLPVRLVEHRATEPVGPGALAELGAELYADQDPLGPDTVEDTPWMSVALVSGSARSLDARYALRIALPLHEQADLDLAQIGDELAITIDGRRRLVALPAVLRRCTVISAVAGDDGLTVEFRPDPELWMR